MKETQKHQLILSTNTGKSLTEAVTKLAEQAQTATEAKAMEVAAANVARAARGEIPFSELTRDYGICAQLFYLMYHNQHKDLALRGRPVLVLEATFYPNPSED